MTELESNKQKRIMKQYEAEGWLVVKIIQTNKNGFPDLMLLRNGHVFFIEVKREGENPRALQLYRKKELNNKGFTVLII